jgi:spermidine synthase
MTSPKPYHERWMRKTRENLRSHFAIHLVVFLTGFTFLLYEVSWNRLLSLVLGSTVAASTIVLASFMAGLGLGAYFWGRTANDMRRIGRLLELPQLYSSLSNSGFSSGMIEVLVFVGAACIVFIPAFLMGGVFPLASKIAIGSDSSIASCLGRLYSLETLGSALGGLATGFLLLGTLGQRNTVALAVIINLALATGLFLTNTRRAPAQQAVDGEQDKAVARRSRHGMTPGHATHRRTALIGTFVCGLAILGLQVLWIRIFRIYLTNTSYTFALVSSVAILGLFAGSAHFRRQAHRIDDYPRSMFRVILLLGASTGLGLLLLIYLPHVLMFPFLTLLENPIARALLLPFVASMLLVFPPAALSGYAFPLACRLYASGKQNISRDVGTVLMVNTLGCVLGPIAAAFLLMPGLGVTKSVLLIAVLLALTALYIQHSEFSARAGWLYRGAIGAGVAALGVLIVLGPDIRILPPSFSRFDREVLFYRESVEGTLTVGQDRGARAGTKYAYVNNSTVIGTTYEAIKVVKMVGHTPFFLGLACKDVLVIGFGIGVTTAAIASHPEVESIECVELVEGMIEAAALYRDLNRDVAEDPRLTLISGDGRHYLQMTPKKYDLISCDPTHPILGSGNLYTKEYFALCKDHLNPGGMVSQYMPLHKLRPKDFLGIIATFHSEFPNCTVWLGHYHAVLLGSVEPLAIDFEDWARNIGSIGKDPYFYADPYHLAATMVLDGDAVGELTSGLRVNTDDRSYTEFFAPACLDAGNTARNLSLFMETRTAIDKVFSNIPKPARMARFIEGNRLLTESLFYRQNRDNQRSLQTLRRACQVNPEDQELPLLMRLYF